jgi:plasmid stabilization system protein ParE
MYGVFILEEALEDLTTIVAHISAENVAAAETLGNELIDDAMTLEMMPYRGSVVTKQPALRKLIHGNYLVYYRTKEAEKAVEIVSFIHSAQIK